MDRYSYWSKVILINAVIAFLIYAIIYIIETAFYFFSVAANFMNHLAACSVQIGQRCTSASPSLDVYIAATYFIASMLIALSYEKRSLRALPII